MNTAAAALLAVSAVALLSREAIAATETADAAPAAGEEGSAEASPGSWFSSAFDMISDTISGSDGNRAAFLAMLRRSETGTDGAAAYSILVGGGRFTDFSQHPRILNRQLNSTAAGAYQINWPTWSTEIVPALHPADFGPAAQDAAALYLLRRSGALAKIDAGDFAAAVRLAAPRWASLAGAGYTLPDGRPQPEHSIATLQGWYQAAGGNVA